MTEYLLAVHGNLVDNTADTAVITDGPYIESKEYLGGFWVIDVPDLDAAIEWAKEGSKACTGRVEVRPFQSDADDAAMRTDA